mmetsp:Transcript_25303/g.58761  ORF Transcript_25303/g.58761 Transcript_25303/m.58761 type:complete len:343 (+) Transcript_25303:58-1086(+)
MLGSLTPREQTVLYDLEQSLIDTPTATCSVHDKEYTKRRLLRFLRAEGWDPTAAFLRIHSHAEWWNLYGMDSFRPEDEYDEQGIVFVCGSDLDGHPTLIARPAAHKCKGKDDSIQAARRAVYTMQRCLERLPPGLERVGLIYDVHGLHLQEVDLTFTRELMAVFQHQFPERMGMMVVINNSWMTSALWQVVQTFLDPITRAKLHFLGTNFEQELTALVGPDHPYLRYALAVGRCSAKEAAIIPLPRAAPYVPVWQEAVAADAAKYGPCGSSGEDTDSAQVQLATGFYTPREYDSIAVACSKVVCTSTGVFQMTPPCFAWLSMVLTSRQQANTSPIACTQENA